MDKRRATAPLRVLHAASGRSRSQGRNIFQLSIAVLAYDRWQISLAAAGLFAITQRFIDEQIFHAEIFLPKLNNFSKAQGIRPSPRAIDSAPVRKTPSARQRIPPAPARAEFCQNRKVPNRQTRERGKSSLLAPRLTGENQQPGFRFGVSGLSGTLKHPRPAFQPYNRNISILTAFFPLEEDHSASTPRLFQNCAASRFRLRHGFEIPYHLLSCISKLFFTGLSRVSASLCDRSGSREAVQRHSRRAISQRLIDAAFCPWASRKVPEFVIGGRQIDPSLVQLGSTLRFESIDVPWFPPFRR